jgi:hypothetical protein
VRPGLGTAVSDRGYREGRRAEWIFAGESVRRSGMFKLLLVVFLAFVVVACAAFVAAKTKK